MKVLNLSVFHFIYDVFLIMSLVAQFLFLLLPLLANISFISLPVLITSLSLMGHFYISKNFGLCGLPVVEGL